MIPILTRVMAKLDFKEAVKRARTIRDRYYEAAALLEVSDAIADLKPAEAEKLILKAKEIAKQLTDPEKKELLFPASKVLAKANPEECIETIAELLNVEKKLWIQKGKVYIDTDSLAFLRKIAAILNQVKT